MHTDTQRDGDLAPPQTDPPPIEPIPLRPLTLRRKQGPRAGELYARENPRIERDIRSVLQLAPADLAARIVEINYPEIETLANLPEDALCAEALVYLYRHHWTESRRLFDVGRYREAKAHSEAVAALGDAIDHVVSRHLRRKLSNLQPPKREEAEDEVQTHMTDLLHDLSPDGDPLEACFGLVLMRLCIDAFNTHSQPRRHKRMSDYETDQAAPAPINDPPPNPDSFADEKDVFDLLPEDEREAFVRREMEGVDYAVLEAELGVSRRTISDRKRKAKATLRDILEDDDNQPESGA